MTATIWEAKKPMWNGKSLPKELIDTKEFQALNVAFDISYDTSNYDSDVDMTKVYQFEMELHELNNSSTVYQHIYGEVVALAHYKQKVVDSKRYKSQHKVSTDWSSCYNNFAGMPIEYTIYTQLAYACIKQAYAEIFLPKPKIVFELLDI